MKVVSKIVFTILFLVVITTIMIKVRVISYQVVGNEKASEEKIIGSIFENDYDYISSILFLREKLNKKKNIPMINSYEIKWKTPFDIIIKVTENPSVAFFKRDLNNVYFDKEGVINEISTDRQDELLEVIGLSFRNIEKGEKIDFGNKKLLSVVLNISTFVKEYGLPVKLLEIGKNDEIFIYVNNVTVNMGNIQNMEVKLQRLNDIFPKIKDLKGTLDLSTAKENMYDEQYIFKKSN